MPFFDHTGREIDDEHVESLHVLTPQQSVLGRQGLQAIIEKSGYALRIVDPSDYSTLLELPADGACLLISTSKESLQRLPKRLRRKAILGLSELVLVDLVIESPYDIQAILGQDRESLAQTFGHAGAEIMLRAMTVYAVNVPAQEASFAPQVLKKITLGISSAVAGEIYDPATGKFGS